MNERQMEALVQEIHISVRAGLSPKGWYNEVSHTEVEGLAKRALAAKELSEGDEYEAIKLVCLSFEGLNRMDVLTEELEQVVRTRRDVVRLNDDELRHLIDQLVFEKSALYGFNVKDKAYLSGSVFSSIRGFGVLDDIMKDESITEVMINGPNNIFIEKNGRVQRLNRRFESTRRLENIIHRIASQSGRAVTQADPICDTRLPDGSRVSIVLPPVSLIGPVVTIRKFSKTPMTVDQLIRYGSITTEISAFLEKLVKAKYNIFISGGTGSGKTTFLNALSNFIPKDERIITIEDSAELKIVGIENLVSLETRNTNTSGKGEISIRDLIKSALRMRPERIVVGEVRGEEALDMLQAMNTGHDGSLSTGHANSSLDMLHRLETMVLQGSSGMPLLAIRQQIASALDIIVHLSRLRDHTRKTVEIVEVLGIKDDDYELNTLYAFEEDEYTTVDHVSGKLIRTNCPMKHTEKLQMAGIRDVF